MTMDQQQQQLRTWFDAIDTSRNGELDASELQQALRLGNLHFGLTDVVSFAATALVLLYSLFSFVKNVLRKRVLVLP